MRYLYLLSLLCLFSIDVSGQKKLDQKYPTSGLKSVELAFTWPELIIVRKSTGSEVMIKGTVSINNGENDDAFQFTSTTEDGHLSIESFIKDRDKLPKRIKIGNGDEEVYFKAESMDDPIVQKYLEGIGRNYKYVNQGVIKDIILEIHVPENLELTVNSKYGVIEVEDFSSTATFQSKYGGVDMTVSTSDNLEIKARTKYGDVFTDLDKNMLPNPNPIKGMGKWMTITGKIGSGANRCTLESQYGNVYIRKAK